jgi:hypothetical protein
MTKATVIERLLATLKRHNPARVRALAGDDDARDIAVPTRRKRWTQVIEAIEARAWSRVELLDKSGAVLAYVENTAPAEDVEELQPEGGGKVLRTRSEAEWIVALVVKTSRESVKEALQYRDEEIKTIMGAQGAVVRELTAGMQQLAGMYREQVGAAQDLARIQAEAATGGDSLRELLDAAPQILSMLPMLRALVAGPAKPKTGG